MTDLEININKANGIPVYLQIKKQLHKYIISRNLQNGTLLPDIKIIAACAGVSLNTADQGVKALINDGICVRRPKKGTYVADAPPPSEVKDIIFLSLPQGTLDRNGNRTDIGLYNGISEQAAIYHADLFITAEDLEHNLGFFANNDGINVKGVVLTENCPLEVAVMMAQKYPLIRFVYANYYFKGIENSPDNIYGVFNDDFAGAYQMAYYMAGKGFRSFGICSIEIDDDNYCQRVDGFLNGLRSHDMSVNDDIVYCKVKQAGHFEFGYRYIKEKLEKNEEIPECILTVNDMMSRGVIQCLQENGLSEKCEVTGYDYIDPGARAGLHFNSVAINFSEIGRKAVDAIINGKIKQPKILKVIPQLIIEPTI